MDLPSIAITATKCFCVADIRRHFEGFLKSGAGYYDRTACADGKSFM
jgi:hypothetical protein